MDENITTDVRIFFEGGAWLVWTAEEVQKLRKDAKVIGEATMTSPWYPKQSIHLSLPFEFTPCEVLWCYNKGFCKTVKPIFKDQITSIKDAENYKSRIQVLHDDTEFNLEDVDPPSINPFLFEVYSDLKSKGFYVGDGSQYSCDFAVYRDAPWCCHSSALIWVEESELNTRTLIQHTRIADAAKKHGIAAIKVESKIKYVEFSRYKFTQDSEA